MRKILLIFIILLSISIVGCKSTDLSEKNDEFVSKEISTIDQLINGSQYTEAKARVEDLASSERFLSESHKESVDIRMKLINEELAK